MAEPKSLYERLSRSRFGLNGTGSLWLGPDHLLQVNTIMAVERYRRWYLSDIQAIVVQQTSRRMIWNLVAGISAFITLGGAAGCLAGSLTSTESDDIAVLGVFAAILGVVGAFLLAIAIINTLMGPGCAVHVQTPHGLDRLSGPARVLVYEKMIARLQPLLLQAQIKPTASGADDLRDVAKALDQPLA